jgi:hypothetical protein
LCNWAKVFLVDAGVVDEDVQAFISYDGFNVFNCGLQVSAIHMKALNNCGSFIDDF